MKRKLNENDVPEEIPPAETASVATTGSTTFTDLGLDARLLQAITKEKFAEPTPVQAKAIPLALEGRDVLGIENRDLSLSTNLTLNSPCENWFR